MVEVELNEIELRYLNRALEIYLDYVVIDTLNPSPEKLAVLQILKQKIQEATK